MQELWAALANPDVNVRLDAVEHLATVAEKLRVPLFTKLVDDVSAVVRQKAAQSISLCPSLFLKFLNDPHPDVRSATVFNSVSVREALLQTAKTNDDQVFDQIARLTKDPSPTVRMSLAKVLEGHAVISKSDIDRVAFAKTKVVPVIIELLRDESDAVRIEAAKNLQGMTRTFFYDFVFENMSECFRLMLDDPQWRVRNEAYEVIMGLSTRWDAPREYFPKELEPFLIKGLFDRCWRTRQLLISALPSLGSAYGSQWVRNILEKLHDLRDSPTAIDKETYLWCLAAVAEHVATEDIGLVVYEPMIHMLECNQNGVVLLAIDILRTYLKSIHGFRLQYQLKPIVESLAQHSSVTLQRAAERLNNEIKQVIQAQYK